MVIDKRRLCLFFILFILTGLSCVYAQIEGYYIDNEGDSLRLIQRLAWSGGDFALRYEIIIQSPDGETFRNIHQEFTTALFVDVSLHPGSYRFCVISYDILGRPYVASEWKYIEVLPALQPELFFVFPENITKDGSDGFLFNIIGHNFDPDSEVFIRYADDSRVEVESSPSDGGIQFFLESAKLSDIITTDEYEIVVRNPGGLEASIEGIPRQRLDSLVQDKTKTEEQSFVPVTTSVPAFNALKPVESSIGIAFQPSFPVLGDHLKRESANFGLTARLNLLFSLPIGIYIGPELSVMLYRGNYHTYFRYMYEDYYSNDEDTFWEDMTFMLGGNLLFRKWFAGERAAISFRAGADYGLLPESVEQINIRTDLSFLWRVTNNLFLEIGLDFSYLITKFKEDYLLPEYMYLDYKPELKGGFFRPWLGISCRF